MLSGLFRIKVHLYFKYRRTLEENTDTWIDTCTYVLYYVLLLSVHFIGTNSDLLKH